ncbi:unnamed protein product [Schistosoma curassoni]|uniref:Secreted protein n=1 Tax=Schistosoma curassoni TaxID=6186 RepID=A0A183KI33_9TREM|nr:unnamed protein product [Schistosoma curassoni]
MFLSCKYAALALPILAFTSASDPRCPTKSLTILMGDFSAKVGTDNTGYEDIMRRHGLGERNENETLRDDGNNDFCGDDDDDDETTYKTE